MKNDLKKIGLALSGGGTKGIAQAGVLKFLKEQNMHPTEIAGTSAGAIVGAMYSWGKTPDEILEFFKSVYFFNWRHFTLKRGGMLDSVAFKTYFQDIFYAFGSFSCILSQTPRPLHTNPIINFR